MPRNDYAVLVLNFGRKISQIFSPSLSLKGGRKKFHEKPWRHFLKLISEDSFLSEILGVGNPPKRIPTNLLHFCTFWPPPQKKDKSSRISLWLSLFAEVLKLTFFEALDWPDSHESIWQHSPRHRFLILRNLRVLRIESSSSANLRSSSKNLIRVYFLTFLPCKAKITLARFK